MIAYRDKPGGPLKGPLAELAKNPPDEQANADRREAREATAGLLNVITGLIKVIAGGREDHAAALDMLADHQDKQDNPEAARINRQRAHLLRELAKNETGTADIVAQAEELLLAENRHPIPAAE